MSTSTTSAPPGTQDPPPAGPPMARGRRTNARTGWRQALRRDWQLYSLAVLPLLFFLVFRYLPMIGNVIAFRRFQPGGCIFGDEWVGLRYVRMFLSDPTFWQVFTNTLWLGGLTLAVLLPDADRAGAAAERGARRALKRFVQSVSYLPHFLSIVIVAGIILQLLAARRHGQPGRRGGSATRRSRSSRSRTGSAPSTSASEVWQTVGWGTILYLAALTTIDEELYEAARIDGANRWQQTWHVTLPGIRPTMITLLILNIGTFMAVGFEKILLLYNPLTYPTADVISTYLYRVGRRVQQLQLRRRDRPVRGGHRPGR